MKPLEQDEIFQNLNGFLKSRGIELKDGSYAQGIQKSCALLTNAINLGQESFERARREFDKTMQHMRKVIHERTAPKPPRMSAAKASTTEAKAASRAAKPKPKAKTAKTKPQPRTRGKTRKTA